MLVPASLDVHSLTLVVYVCAVVWACILYVCESLKVEGGAVMVTFNLGTAGVLHCNEVLGTSSLHTVKRDVV